MRAGTLEVPHQPGQRRQGRATRGQLRADDRGRLPPWQAGSHRRQLGIARPGAARADDGRERRSRDAVGCERRAARGPGALGDRECAARGGARPAGRWHLPVGQGERRAGPDRGVPRAGAPVRLPAAPRPDGGRDGQQGHRRVDGGACGPAAGGHRRHDPRVPDAGARGARTREVQVAQEILQTMGLRAFTPMVVACPGCGRTTSTFFQELADKIQTYLREQMPAWRSRIPASSR
jgi:hypothetical protein